MKNDLENGTGVPGPLISRRTFMLAGGRNRWCRNSVTGRAGVDGCPAECQQDRPQRSQMESPIKVVRRFCAAWPTMPGPAELAAFFTDDAVYHNIPLAPVTGREAIANTIASFIRPGAPGIEVSSSASSTSQPMSGRDDRAGGVFKLPNKSFELPVMGTFEVSDGKINAWRDYFDMNQSPAGWDKAGPR